jgi:hypothetical protein
VTTARIPMKTDGAIWSTLSSGASGPDSAVATRSKRRSPPVASR